MSKFTCDINVDERSNKDHLIFEILGNEEYGLNRTIINAIRRTLLSSIETYAFRTNYEKSDIVIEKNETSLHNEFILDRVGLIPLYLDPKLVEDNPLKYLFVLKVKHDNSNPVTLITADDFEIYQLKETVSKSSDYINGMVDFDKNNYDMNKTISNKDIFRPYSYNGKDHYCLLHELKSTSSTDNVQELVLYGSPSVSISKEDARWQGVSCATYSYKINDELCKKIIAEKLSREEDLPEEEHESFKKDLFLKEGQRYYHRDVNAESYWYNFDLESQHFLNAKDLFLRANEIIIYSLEVFKEELLNIQNEDIKSLIHLKYSNDEKKKNVINMVVEMRSIVTPNSIWHGFDDTLGSIIQAHISNKMINNESVLNLIGYKRTHPLEDKYLFTVSFNPKHHLGSPDTEEKTKTSAIVQVFSECCDELTGIFNTIMGSAGSI